MERNGSNYEGKPDLRTQDKNDKKNLPPYRYEMIQKYTQEKKATML